MTTKVISHALYYIIIIESDNIFVSRVPLIGKERPKKLSFRTGNITCSISGQFYHINLNSRKSWTDLSFESIKSYPPPI